MHVPHIVSDAEWRRAVEEIHAEEKRAARERDALAARRRRLLAVAVDDSYSFHGPEGDVTLLAHRDGDRILRTYFTDRRGVEALGSVWTFLDLTPLGRQEEWEDSPDGVAQAEPYLWWRRHDEYEAVAAR